MPHLVGSIVKARARGWKSERKCYFVLDAWPQHARCVRSVNFRSEFSLVSANRDLTWLALCHNLERFAISQRWFQRLFSPPEGLPPLNTSRIPVHTLYDVDVSLCGPASSLVQFLETLPRLSSFTARQREEKAEGYMKGLTLIIESVGHRLRRLKIDASLCTSVWDNRVDASSLATLSKLLSGLSLLETLALNSCSDLSSFIETIIFPPKLAKLFIRSCGTTLDTVFRQLSQTAAFDSIAEGLYLFVREEGYANLDLVAEAIAGYNSRGSSALSQRLEDNWRGCTIGGSSEV